MGASHVHVHWGLLEAAAGVARLRKEGNAGEPLLSDAEPALHRLSLARSARWLVTVAVRSRAGT